LLEHNIHLPRFHRDVPSRFAVIPRRGDTSQVMWFEADPTYVLHFPNAYEDGDEIVVDGFFQGDPEPTEGVDNGMSRKWQQVFRSLSLDGMQTRL
ncbi:apocarotenoid-15,15'-oxygenase, partial [Mycobacterium sp. ITM-2017-0098]